MFYNILWYAFVHLFAITTLPLSIWSQAWISNNQAQIIPSRNKQKHPCLSLRKKYAAEDKLSISNWGRKLKKNETKIPERLNKESSEKKARYVCLKQESRVSSWQLEFVLIGRHSYLHSCRFCSSLKWKLPDFTWLLYLSAFLISLLLSWFSFYAVVVGCAPGSLFWTNEVF